MHLKTVTEHKDRIIVMSTTKVIQVEISSLKLLYRVYQKL